MKRILASQYAYVKNLNDEVYSALYRYTESSTQINNSLYRKKSINPRIDQDIKLITRAFEGAPAISAAITVYRGIVSDNFLPEIKAFISTSHSRETALDLVGKNCCLLEILVTPGSKVLPLEEMSDVKHEREILLPCTGHFITTHTFQEKELLVYQLTYVSSVAVEITPATKIETVQAAMSIDVWAERLIYLAEEDVTELGESPEDAIRGVLQLNFKDQSVPKEAVLQAIAHFKSTV